MKTEPQVREEGFQNIIDEAPEPLAGRTGGPGENRPLWKLEVVQHPVKARSCGNGTKDFRTIDPVRRCSDYSGL